MVKSAMTSRSKETDHSGGKEGVCDFTKSSISFPGGVRSRREKVGRGRGVVESRGGGHVSIDSYQVLGFLSPEDLYNVDAAKLESLAAKNKALNEQIARLEHEREKEPVSKHVRVLPNSSLGHESS